MLIIAITGGISTGKSLLSTYIKERGYEVIDSDEEALLAVQPGKSAYEKIRSEFGSDFFDSSGQLRRDLLASLIFNDEQKRRKLNSFVHPEVIKSIICRVILCALKLNRCCFIDVPLLYETNSDRFVCKTIVIQCNEKNQLNRLIARNNLTEEEALARISAQMPLEEKCCRSTYVIDNNGSFDDAISQMDKILVDIDRSWIPFIFRISLISLIPFLLFILVLVL